MADYRAVVTADIEDVERGAHLNKTIDATSFNNLLTKTDVTAAKTEAENAHADVPVVVAAWTPHADNDDAGVGEDFAGSHTYIRTKIEFYTDRGEKITALTPDNPVVGQSLTDATYADFDKLYVTSQAFNNGHSQTTTVSDNMNGFTVALSSDEEELEIPVDSSNPNFTKTIKVFEIEVNIGAAGRPAGTEITGNISVAAVATATTATAPAPQYSYTAKTQTLPVSYTVVAA